MKTYTFVMFVVLLASLASAQTSAVNETGKVVVMHLNFTDSGLMETRSGVVYGLPPDLSDNASYTATVLDGSNSSLENIQFSDPRYYFGDELGEGGMVGLSGFNPDAELVLILTFNPNMSKLMISNTSSGEKIYESDLTPLVQDFCASYPQDVDCEKEFATAEATGIDSWLLPAIGMIVLVVIVGAFVFLKRKRAA